MLRLIRRPRAFNETAGQNSPSLSIVSLILLAAFSLSSPGWLLLMENKVITPATSSHVSPDVHTTTPVYVRARNARRAHEEAHPG